MAAPDATRRASAIGELVGLLRDVHERRRAPEPGLDPEPAPRAASRAPSTALVEALRRLHEAQGGAVREPAEPEAAGEPDAPARYDRVRRLFRRRERALREEALLVDRILDQVRAGEAPRAQAGDAVLQQTLRIACTPRGRSAGRFLVVNETEAPTRVEVRIGRPALRGAAPLEGVALSAEPALVALAAGGAREAEITVDLAGCPAGLGERIDVAIELHDGERRLGRVWVEIVVAGERR